ncbi:MAG: phosphatase PAP2 family protein [Melioribacteraceae bacterium]|nr:phosphatase PAP2 family protein [Melioribacteraceae bacterium]
MIERIRLTFIILFLFSVTYYPQDRYNISRLGDDAVSYIKQPVNWTTKDVLNLALILGSTWSLMYIDDDIREMINTGNSFRALEIGRYWGEPSLSLLLGASLLLHGVSNNNEANRKFGFEILQSMIYSGALTHSLKFIIGRSRPFTGGGPFSFSPFQSFNDENWSLPSGHATAAFSLSTIISQNVSSDFLKYFVFIPALVTAYSRVDYDVHWTSDVFLGAAIGYFSAKFISKLHKDNLNKTDTRAASTPLVSLQIQF